MKAVHNHMKQLVLVIVLGVGLVAVAAIAEPGPIYAPKENKLIDNRHSHTSLGDTIEDLQGNEAVVQNDGDSHYNSNFNYNRDPGDPNGPNERYNINEHDIPNKKKD
jgi:hypothetical protein